jgi:hypothetical protein
VGGGGHRDEMVCRKGVEQAGDLLESLQDTVQGHATTIIVLRDWIEELEMGHRILQGCVIHIKDRMDVDPQVEDLTGLEVDGENSLEEPLASFPSGSSSSSDSSSSDLYSDGVRATLCPDASRNDCPIRG